MYIYELYDIIGMIIYSEMGFKYGVILDSWEGFRVFVYHWPEIKYMYQGY